MEKNPNPLLKSEDSGSLFMCTDYASFLASVFVRIAWVSSTS